MEKQLTANELRQKFIDFFVSKEHTQISGASLIPENDPTVLFTTAGMHPLVPYIPRCRPSRGKRLVNYQKCIRTGDIEAVGDPHHLTFFEMLGNWSLGDYFKKEAITYSYEFLTEILGLDINELSVTVFAGDDEVPRDNTAYEMWRSVGIPEERIYFLGREDNWWGPAGETGPCGPDTEMFIDTGRPPCGDNCRPGCSCGKYFEIWNDVFMGYKKNADGSYVEMSRKCVDTGMGIERTTAILQGKQSVYETEVFAPIIAEIERLSSKRYGDDEGSDTSIRILADHVRTSVFILGDQRGMAPSNVGQGYILRRLIRRAVRHGHKLGIEERSSAASPRSSSTCTANRTPSFCRTGSSCSRSWRAKRRSSPRRWPRGAEFEKMLPNLLKGKDRIISGRTAFKLYDTYGYPLELTAELAGEHGFTVDEAGFNAAFEKHQEISRSGASQQFKEALPTIVRGPPPCTPPPTCCTKRSGWSSVTTWGRRDRTSPSIVSASTSPIPPR